MVFESALFCLLMFYFNINDSTIVSPVLSKTLTSTLFNKDVFVLAVSCWTAVSGFEPPSPHRLDI